MSALREIRCFEYVNRPYPAVSDLLTTDAPGLFQRATASASARAASLASQLKVEVAGLQIDQDILIEVTKVSKGRLPHALVEPATSIELTWRAASHPRLFPTMRAELLAYPLSEAETQLDLLCSYTPPGGVAGGIADTLVGHRLAEASVHRFLQEIVLRLRIDAE